MVKRFIVLFIAALMFTSCGSDSNKEDDIRSASNALTKIERTYVLPNTGSVKVTCEYTDSGDEICTGIYEATGLQVPADVVNELVEFPMIDARIETAVKAGCENKILALNADLRDDYPNILIPESGNPDSALNKEFYQKKQESRAEAMDAFVADNPGLLSDAVVQDYKSGGYSFMFNLNACDYDEFIKKNKYKLHILELSGVVDSTPAQACDNPLDYVILRNDNLSIGKENNSKGEYHIFDNAASYHEYVDSQEPYYTKNGQINIDFDGWASKYKSIADNIDFGKYNLLTIQTESGSGSVQLKVMKACNNQLEVDSTWCEGHAMTADMAYPIMMIRIPKITPDVTIGTKGLACNEDSPLPGSVPEQNVDIQELKESTTGSCDNPVSYTMLERTNLGGSGDANWNTQTAHPIHDLTSFAEYLDTLRTRLLGEYFDGADNSTHYSFDSYLEKYKDFDFNTNMLVALEGGSQPSGGYGIEVASVCNNTVEFNITWCNSPDIGYTADIGYPFMLISLPKGDYAYKGGVNPNKCH